MINYEHFEKSLKHLELQFENYQSLNDSIPQITQEAICESVIQRFEVCLDCLWKVLKRHLAEVLGLADVPSSPKPIIRMAAQNGLLISDVEVWFDYINARNGTSHEYSGDKMQQSLILAPAFLADAIALYKSLTGKEWV